MYLRIGKTTYLRKWCFDCEKGSGGKENRLLYYVQLELSLLVLQRVCRQPGRVILVGSSHDDAYRELAFTEFCPSQIRVDEAHGCFELALVEHGSFEYTPFERRGVRESYLIERVVREVPSSQV